METLTSLSARSLQYYVITNKWSSDLEFFRVECGFFHRLLDDYFVRLSDSIHIAKLKELGQKLYQLERDSNLAEKKLSKQLGQLELMAEDVIPEDAEELAGKQVELEYLMCNLTREHREVKNELFRQVEAVITDSKYTTG